MSAPVPGVVKTDDKIGRYLEATRDIRQGEIIIQEDALVTGPSGDPSPHSICLGCYCVITSNPVECSVCKWPMCSEKCEKLVQHAKFECKVFKNNKVKPSNDAQDYLNIKIMRCLQLKEVSMKKYEQLMTLESHSKTKPKVASKEICEFIHKKCNLKQFDTSLVNLVAGIVNINSYSTTDRITLVQPPRMASLLFLNASMMSHDCVPNTSWIRVENPDNTFSIKVWATVPIKAGQLITTQYLDITRSTNERRAHLQDIYLFACNCKRCVDPKELGTYYSAVKCAKCPKGKGYLLSTEPLKGADAQWKCDSCGGAQHYRESSGKIETDIVGEIQAAEDEDALEQVLEKHAGVNVHPNHYLMMDIRQEIVKRLYNHVATIKDEAKRKEKARKMSELCKSLMTVTEVFYPGHNRIKARLLYYSMYSDACANGLGESADKDLEKIEDIIREGKEMLMFEA